MIIKMSKGNGKRLLHGFEYFNNIGQNYFTSQNNSNNNSMSSGKKFINALLLTPVIVTTAITLSLIGCTYLCLNAVKAQDDDSTLSKVAKSAVRYLIYLAAFVVLSTCIVLNLAISLIPFLTFRAINKGIFNKESDAPDIIHTTDAPGQAQPTTNTVFTDSGEYKEHVNGALNNLNSSTESINNEDEELNRALISPPTVQVISLNTGNPDQVNKTIVVKGINDRHMQNGKAVIISKTNKEEARFACVIANDHVIPDNAMKSSAAACKVRCTIVDNGVDFSFSASVRTGATQEQAINQLLQGKAAQGILRDCEVEVQAITQAHS